jgi:hypothetical protein
MADVNGNGKVATLADSVWLILASRLVSVVGVPLAGFVFLQLYNSVKDLGAEVARLSTQVQLSNERILSLKEANQERDRRIQILEDRIRRGP